MADEVINRNEVILNGVRYPIVGLVSPVRVSRFPEKTVTGDYTGDSLQDLSSWSIQDQRGGILIEEMDEEKDANRCWWSTCNLGYKGHITLPRLATSVTLPTCTSVSITNADMELDANWTTGAGTPAQSNTQAHGGTYSWNVSGVGSYAYQDLTWTTEYQSRRFTFKCYVYTGTASAGRIEIDDGVGTTASSYHTGSSTWELLTVTRELSASATRLRLHLWSNNAAASYFDDASIVIPTLSNVLKFENFNGYLYLAAGNVLAKLNAGGTAFDYICNFATNITDMVSSLNSCLYIGLGDTEYYWYVSTADAETQTNVTDATLLAQWDNKLFKMDNDGNSWYATTPNSATPSWTTAGNITDLPAGAVNNLKVYFDADGDDALYAGTTKGLKILDLTNTKWYDTALELGDHPNGAMGMIKWRDGLYVSAGLNVQKYIAGSPAIIQSIGLDKDDGLPVEYNGEIVMLGGKNNTQLLAVVDSTQVTGTSTSGLYAYDGTGWQCWWIGDSTEKAMHYVLASSAYGYRAWFDHNNTVYYIDIPRGLDNPKKLTTFTYASAGVHITPWFDAGWALGQKLAGELKVRTTGCSATETVIVKYRINRAYTTLADGWTTLGTITTNGETSYTFASSVGENYREIQFRFDLARGSTNTNSPDINYSVHLYEKVISPKWGWQFIVNCEKPYGGKAPLQLLDALVTAAELQTKVAFVYQASTKYVRVVEVEGERLTGYGYKGQYRVFVKET